MPVSTLADRKRFWALVKFADVSKCWLWQGPTIPQRGNYGRFYIKRIAYRTNRIAYWFYFNTDPKDEDICHTCDNPPCCNPFHLFKGTRAENLTDMREKDRHAIGERHGISKLTNKQVAEIKSRYIPRKVPMHKLAAEYGVCQMTINNIIHGKIWRHVNSE